MNKNELMDIFKENQTIPADGLDEYYDFFFGPWQSQNLLFSVDLINYLSKEIVNLDQGHKYTYLDVGAGPGFSTEIVGRIFSNGFTGYELDCFGLDINQDQPRLYKALHEHAVGLHGDLYDLEEDSYDIVVCSHVIEHLPRDEVHKFVQQMRRVAKHFVIIICPWKEDPDNLIVVHSTSIDEEIVERCKPDHWETFDSLGWRNPPMGYQCLAMILRNS